ncbi:14682_t:CDS:2, partial [Gigaspora rosea]
LSINPVGFFSKTEHIDGEKKNTYEFIRKIVFESSFRPRYGGLFKLFTTHCKSLCADDKFIYVDKIGDASIRLQFGQFKTWTKALKYTLTDTKWILAYALSTSHDWG